MTMSTEETVRDRVACYVSTKLKEDGYVVVDNFYGDDFISMRDELQDERRQLGDNLSDVSNYASLWAFRDNETIREYFDIAYATGDRRGGCGYAEGYQPPQQQTGMLSCRSPLIEFTHEGPWKHITKGRGIFVADETSVGSRLSTYVTKGYRKTPRYSTVCVLQGEKYPICVVRGSHLLHGDLFAFANRNAVKLPQRYTEEKETFKLITLDTVKAFIADGKNKQKLSSHPVASSVDIVEVQLREGSLMLYDRRLLYCKSTTMSDETNMQKNTSKKKDKQSSSSPPPDNHSPTKPPLRNISRVCVSSKSGVQTRGKKTSTMRIANDAREEVVRLVNVALTPYTHLKVNVANNSVKNIFFNMPTGEYGLVKKRSGASMHTLSVSPTRSSCRPSSVEDQIYKYLRIIFPPITSDEGVMELSGLEYFTSRGKKPSVFVSALLKTHEKHYMRNRTNDFVSALVDLRKNNMKSNDFFRSLVTQPTRDSQIETRSRFTKKTQSTSTTNNSHSTDSMSLSVVSSLSSPPPSKSKSNAENQKATKLKATKQKATKQKATKQKATQKQKLLSDPHEIGVKTRSQKRELQKESESSIPLKKKKLEMLRPKVHGVDTKVAEISADFII